MDGRTVILDTNLLLLLVVGLTNRPYVAAHKCLKAYGIEDFDLLIAMLGKARAILLTPNTLTETSNLARQIKDPARSEIMATLAGLISKYPESHCSSISVADRPEFIRLGLTDAILLAMPADHSLLLTTDAILCDTVQRQGRNAINFNHHRGL